MKTVLSIAGSDASGGAGIQADIKTLTMNGVYAMCAITALTAQNTLGVYGVQESTPALLKLQMKAVFEDIVPDAVKIGMVSSAKLISVIADTLQWYHAKNIVLDPVMVSTSGTRLIHPEAIAVLTSKLFPLATLVTPNRHEAEILCGKKMKSDSDDEDAIKYISETYGCSVLLKGGHNPDDANDLLYADGAFYRFYSRRIDNPNTHGTGCTLSSAISANLAKGFSIPDSVQKAKEYVSNALKAGLNLGKGEGPLMHNFG